MGGNAEQRRQRGLRAWWAAVLVAAILLACGTRTTFKPLPEATLVPGVAPFEVVTLDSTELQARRSRTGRVLWHQPVVSASGDTLLAVDGIIVHRALGSEAVEAFAADAGALLWRLSGCPGHDDALTGVGELLFVTCGANAPATHDTIAGDTLYALDTATGTVRWQVHGERFRAVAGDLVITQTPTGLAARTLAQGAARWAHPLTLAPQGTPDPYLPDTPAFDIAITVSSNGMLYLSPDGRHVVALRTSDGSLRWQSVALASAAAPGAYSARTPVYVTAAATADTVVARTTSGTRIVALSANSGAVRWRIGDAPPGSGAVLYTSLVRADGAIFVNGYGAPADQDQTIRRLETETGLELWRAKGPTLDAAPLWYAAGVVYVGDGGRLFTLRASDGTRLWDDLGVDAAHLGADANVVTVADGHELFLLSAVDGKRIWEAKDAGFLQAPPIIIPMSG